MDCLISYCDPSALNTETGAPNLGAVYDFARWKYVGLSRPEPHWLDADGKRINKQAVRALLGTVAKEAVAELRPGWRYVRGTRKHLYMIGGARSVEACLAILAAVPRAPSSRPFAYAVQRSPWKTEELRRALGDDVFDLIYEPPGSR